jgi:predicted DCC family thiol-disulfide oxidoreductase YuxK
LLALLALTLPQLGALLCLHLGLTPWVMLAASAILVDGWIWDALDRRAQRRERSRGPLPLRIYYDRDCGFCLKMCLLLQTFLLLPRAQIAPAQDQARARALLEANYSWVIIDHDDHAFLKWPAFVLLLRRSPLLAWLGWLLSGHWAVPIGNTVYDFVGRHRGAFGKLSAALLPRRPLRFETGAGAQAAAGVALLLVLAWNLAAVHWLPTGVQHLLRPPLRLLRLDQQWTLFAPAPPKESGWFVLPGELADGSQRDLLRPELPAPGYDRPRDPPAAESGSRWERYRESLMARPSGEEAQLYGRYRCRTWNASYPATQALRSFKLVYVVWTTPSPDSLAVDTTARAAEQRVVARFDCAEQSRNPP